MTNPNWKIEALYPDKNQLYKKLQQSKMESWISKTQIMTTQKQEDRTIHPRDCKARLTPRAKLQKQWEQRRQSILEHATEKQREIIDHRNKPYVKEAETTEITQYLDKHPEMTEKWN